MAASTGSPASRRSTNFTPLTTRPSFTSRQGMTRTLNTLSRPRRADQRQRRRRIEAPVIEGAPDDGACQLFCPRRQQGAHVVKRGEAARSDDGDGDLVGKRDGRVEIETLEHAVACNVGIDDGSDARVLETPGDLLCRKLGSFRPAFDRDLAVPSIQSDRDA